MRNQSLHKRLLRSKGWPWLLIPILLALAVGPEGTTGIAQAPGNGPITAMAVSAAEIEWQPQIDHAGLTLAISGPDDLTFRQEFAPGSIPTFELVGPDGQRHPDGNYTYELRAVPVLDAESRAALAAARKSGDSDTVITQLRQAGKLPQQALIQSGYFAITGGEVVLDPAPGPEFATRSVSDRDDGGPVTPQGDEGSVVPLDHLIYDDLIVIGSLCVGTDCFDDYPFSYDTTVLRENNLRIYFDDTSTAASFPSNDWRIILNDSADGGDSYFAVEDAFTEQKILVLEAGAPSNSLYVDSGGNVGIGTTSPAYPLEVARTGTDATFVVERTDGAAAKFSAQRGKVQFGSMTNHSLEWVVNNVPVATLDAGGNLTLDGALIELSDAKAKENWASVDGWDVLARLADVSITTWNYTADDDEVRHMGPMAQDFYSAFGLGPDERHIAPIDTNGVALAAVQELYRLVQAQDAQIARLEQTNIDLEARVAALEALVQTLLLQTQED